jgi:hypothetical protein
VPLLFSFDPNIPEQSLPMPRTISGQKSFLCFFYCLFVAGTVFAQQQQPTAVSPHRRTHNQPPDYSYICVLVRCPGVYNRWPFGRQRHGFVTCTYPHHKQKTPIHTHNKPAYTCTAAVICRLGMLYMLSVGTSRHALSAMKSLYSEWHTHPRKILYMLTVRNTSRCSLDLAIIPMSSYHEGWYAPKFSTPVRNSNGKTLLRAKYVCQNHFRAE